MALNLSCYSFSLYIEIAFSLRISVNNKRFFFFLLNCMLMHYSLRKEHMSHSPIPNAMVTVRLFLGRIVFQWS